jgi:peptidoglycan/LPS O-acetylase OafA/YrhL
VAVRGVVTPAEQGVWPGEDRRYRADIDGLRAVAIVLVVGYHCQIPGFAGGFIGVDIFFAISGFLITGLLHRELLATGRVRWRTFYARRIRRLLPANLAMLCVLLVASLFVLNPLGERQAFAKSALATATFSSNVYFWKLEPVDYFDVADAGGLALLHTWSLSVEEQFYAAVPLVVLLVLVVRRFLSIGQTTALAAAAALLSAVSIALAIWAAAAHPTAGFFLPVTRAYEFGFGALTALLFVRSAPSTRRVRNVVSLLGCGCIAWLLIQPDVAGFPSGWAALPAIGTCLLIASNDAEEKAPRGALGRVLSSRVPVLVGRLSYSWYLWHWALLIFGDALNLGSLPRSAKVGIAVGSLGVAWVSFRFVEQRFRTPPWRAASHPAPRVLRTYGAAVLATAACLGAAGMVGIDARVAKAEPPWEQVAARMKDYAVLPPECHQSEAQTMGDPDQRCVLGSYVVGRPTIVVWGDSHAWQLLPALEAAAAGKANLVAWVAPGCPPFIGVPGTAPASEDASASGSFDQCVRRNRDALSNVLELRDSGPVRVVLAARWATYLAQTPISLADRDPRVARLLDGVRAEYEELPRHLVLLARFMADEGVGADLVGPVPELPRNAPLCLESPLFRDCDLDRSSFDEYSAGPRTLLRTVSREWGGASRVLDLTPTLCDSTRCHAASDGVVNYFDDDHLSATRSRLMAPLFSGTVRAVLGGHVD